MVFKIEKRKIKKFLEKLEVNNSRFIVSLKPILFLGSAMINLFKKSMQFDE